MTQWIYEFGDGKAEGSADMRDLLGGKGANLAEMSSLGLPVPPGFTITTEVCTHYTENANAYPKGLEKEVEGALKKIEKALGRRFGNAEKPLLVSVRSGSRASMPGMMDTIPSLIEKLPMLTESFENAADGLPEPRRYDDLTPSEQRRAAEMLGIDQSTLRESMAAAEAMEDEAMTIDMSDWSDEDLDAAADEAADEIEVDSEDSMDLSDADEG